MLTPDARAQRLFGATLAVVFPIDAEAEIVVGARVRYSQLHLSNHAARDPSIVLRRGTVTDIIHYGDDFAPCHRVEDAAFSVGQVLWDGDTTPVGVNLLNITVVKG